MAIATNVQVQNFSDTQIRPACAEIINLQIRIAQILASIGDVYAAVTQTIPTWTDTRTDGPAHLAVPSDIVAMNTFLTNINKAITTDAQWPICQELRVN